MPDIAKYTCHIAHILVGLLSAIASAAAHVALPVQNVHICLILLALWSQNGYFLQQYNNQHNNQHSNRHAGEPATLRVNCAEEPSITHQQFLTRCPHDQWQSTNVAMQGMRPGCKTKVAQPNAQCHKMFWYRPLKTGRLSRRCLSY